MRTTASRRTLLALALLAAVLFPIAAYAQVEEARVRIDGMV